MLKHADHYVSCPATADPMGWASEVNTHAKIKSIVFLFHFNYPSDELPGIFLDSLTASINILRSSSVIRVLSRPASFDFAF